MKKYLTTFILIAIFIPSVALASWWNPFSWFNGWTFHKEETSAEYPVEKIKTLATTTTNTNNVSSKTRITTTNTEQQDPPVVEKNIPKKDTVQQQIPQTVSPLVVTPPSQQPTAKTPKPKCVSNPSPTFTNHITDMSKVDYLVPPPTIESGINLKPHGYIGTNGVNVPLYAPVAMTLKDGAYYVNGPYLLDFEVSCEVTVRFGHMTNPVESIKKLFPNEPETDSRTHELSPVSFAAGELIGYTTGTAGANAAGNWDFGVYNSSITNRYANDPKWNNHLTNTTAVCPFDYFTPDLKMAYISKFDYKSMAGNPPEGVSFCQ